MTPDVLTGRVGRLEEKVDKIGLDVAELKGRVSQLPTVWQLVGLNIGLAFGVAGLVFAVARAMR